MATGESRDIVNRVKRLIPHRWFSYAAPLRDAILGGLSDTASSFYDLILFAQQQARIKTASGPFLDMIAYEYLGRFLLRSDASDEVFRQQILSTVLQERVTRAGVTSVLTKLTGNPPIIFEPWNTYDTGCYATGFPITYTNTVTTSGSTTVYTPTQLIPNTGPVDANALPNPAAQFGYGVGRGGWGNMDLRGHVFMKQQRGAASGLPYVGGYSSKVKNVISGAGGYGRGDIAYDGPLLESQGVTDEIIESTIVNAKPSGVTAWLQIN